MEKETKIFIFDCDALKDEALFENALSSVPKWRREKVNAARQASDKRLSLGAGVLIERAFGGYDTSAVRFGENGKPFFEHCTQNFSISHSGSIAVLARTELEVGVDVEKITPYNAKIATRFFTPEENRLIDEWKTDEEKAEMFFRLWTLKESFIKLTGRGLSLPLKDFNISFDGDVPKIAQSFSKKEYFLFESELLQGYRLALCTDGKTDVKIRQTTI